MFVTKLHHGLHYIPLAYFKKNYIRSNQLGKLFYYEFLSTYVLKRME